MKELLELLTNIRETLTLQVVFGKKVLSLQQAAQYLDLSEAMVYKLTSERSIPHSKPSGKKIFFNREDLDEWALSNRVRTVVDIEKEARARVNGKSHR